MRHGRHRPTPFVYLTVYLSRQPGDSAAALKASAMKGYCIPYSLLISLLLSAMALASCGKGDSPSTPDNPSPNPPVTPTGTLNFTGQYSAGRADVGADVNSISVDFSASGNWSVAVPQVAASWCRVSPSSGGTDVGTVVISISRNDNYDERNASLTFACGSAKKTFVVTQKQRDAMILDSSAKVEVEEAGGSFTIKVKANVDVACKIQEQCSGWIHLSGSRSLTDRQYAFRVDENETAAPRQGTIAFSGAGVTEEVSVYQIGGNSLLLTEDLIYANPQGGRFGAELRSNCEFAYAIGEGAEWLHEDASRAMSSHTIYFIADPNDTDDSRTATVTFTSEDGTAAERLTVVQRDKSALICGTPQIDAQCAGGEYDIEYSSTREDVRIKTPDWINVSENKPISRALRPYSARIRISPNLSKDARQGHVVFTIDGGTAADSILVTQKGLEYSVSTSLREGDFNDARSHDFSVNVISPMEAELVATDPIKKLSSTSFRMPANYVRGSMGSSSIKVVIAGVTIETVLVNYSAPITPEIEETEINVSCDGGKAGVNINANTDISVSIQGSPSWIRLEEAKVSECGTAKDRWVFAVDKNESTASRQAAIQFSAGSLWSGSAVIVQEGAPKPVEKEQTVDVGGEGALEETLGDGLMEIEKLTVSGGVNGKDVATLREMATDGALIEIDLTNTALKKDLQNEYYKSYEKPGKITEDNMIGHYMFYQTNVERVALPSSLKKIGYCAFNSSKIREIEIPEGVVEIEESAFRNCDKLRRAVVPGSVAEVPDRCFEAATSLSEVSLAEGIRAIGKYAFAPHEAYTTMGALTDIALPSTLKDIGRGAFMATKIHDIVIPESVENIGEGAFTECRSLAKIEFNCELDTLPSRLLHNTLGITELKFPKGLKVIGDYALDHIGMDYLVIPEGVVELKRGACNGSGKKGLALPESLEVIGAYALGYQSMCNSFTIPSKVRYIGNRAFDGACYIKELHIKSHTPPERGGDIFFEKFKYEECTLYVPAGSKQAYSSDSYWKKFKAIVEE